MNTFLGMPVTAPRGVGHLRGDQSFPAAAREALGNAQLRRNLRHATTTIRGKSGRVIAELPDWQQLRDAGSAIKADAMARLPSLLEQLEENVTAAGGVVHWAADANEANAIVTDLVRRTGSERVIKVKSMATQEIGLNEALEAAGITPVETDLAELIVQLGDDKPSHILVPAIHRNRSEIREIFLRAMPGVDPALTDDPPVLAAAARRYLRETFLSTKVAVSGANFAIADSGTLGVVESEGNGRMCLTLPDTLITVMGIEKVLPTWADLEVFLQLLPRSSTGERMNPYTTMWTGVTPGDGPQNFHLVLLDNGRSAVLADPTGRQALHCIRCSACLNVCPVYERTGGHSYGSVYPGPIGAVLSPQLTGIADNASLPYASSLCGACFDACPVKIDIPSLLVHLRNKVPHPPAERAAMAAAAYTMDRPRLYASAQRAAKFARIAGRRGRGLPPPLSGWTAGRDLPEFPKQTFRDWWAARTPPPPSPTPPTPPVAPSPGSPTPPVSPSPGSPGSAGSSSPVQLGEDR
ncbi:LutB/LldF family L-lactate oxidation iron-sulfur protein [Actinoplanes sp. NPDC023801]|uniref:LutB/LldF family L-lactate oxidation iron-sulfur protein n=1 Tax=Actinoplanes sp. NPDC023801 TaxID=3154595 RepID=UPI0033E5376D